MSDLLTPRQLRDLAIAIRHLERARAALVRAVGEPPPGRSLERDHPVEALDVAIHMADCAVGSGSDL